MNNNITLEELSQENLESIEAWLDSCVDEIFDFIDRCIEDGTDNVPTMMWGVFTRYDQYQTDEGDAIIGFDDEDAHILNAKVDGGFPRNAEDRNKLFVTSGYAMAKTVYEDIEAKEQPLIFGTSSEVWYARDGDSESMPSERVDRREGIMILLRSVAGTGRFCFRQLERDDDNMLVYEDGAEWDVQKVPSEAQEIDGVMFGQIAGLHVGATIAAVESLGFSAEELLVTEELGKTEIKDIKDILEDRG